MSRTRLFYILYDDRAYSDPDEAIVLCTASSLKEARRDKREMFPQACIYEYDLVPAAEPGKPDEIENGRLVE